MATYKKRGQKKSVTQPQQTPKKRTVLRQRCLTVSIPEPIAEELFPNTKTLSLVIGGAALLVLSYLGYCEFCCCAQSAKPF